MIELPHDEIMVGRNGKEHRCSGGKSDRRTDVETFEHEKLNEMHKGNKAPVRALEAQAATATTGVAFLALLAS